MAQNKFTINYAQRLIGPSELDGYYHSFAALLPKGEVVGDFWRGAQKLHFNDDIFERMSALVREGNGKSWEDKVDLDPCAEGDERIILPRWNHGLSFAVEIEKKYSIAFDKQRTNCLTGAKKAIEVMGLEFRDEFSKSAVGLQTNEIPSFPEFVLDASNPEHTDLPTMRALNRELIRKLPANEYMKR